MLAAALGKKGKRLVDADWTPEEDQQLIRMYSNGVETRAIATKLCRGTGDVQSRIRTLRSKETHVSPAPDSTAKSHPRVPKKEWTAEEDLELVQCVATNGTQWTLISSSFSTDRSREELSKRWTVLQPLLNEHEYSSPEDLAEILRVYHSGMRPRKVLSAKLLSKLNKTFNIGKPVANTPFIQINHPVTASASSNHLSNEAFSSASSHDHLLENSSTPPPPEEDEIDVERLVREMVEVHMRTMIESCSDDSGTRALDQTVPAAANPVPISMQEWERQREVVHAIISKSVHQAVVESETQANDDTTGMSAAQLALRGGGTAAFAAAWHNLETAGWNGHTPSWSNVFEPPRCVWKSLLTRSLACIPLPALLFGSQQKMSSSGETSSPSLRNLCPAVLMEQFAGLSLKHACANEELVSLLQ